MNRIGTRDVADEVQSQVEEAQSDLAGLGKSLYYYFFTRPGRWAGENPNAALGIVAGIGILIGLSIGLLFRR